MLLSGNYLTGMRLFSGERFSSEVKAGLETLKRAGGRMSGGIG